MVGNETIDGIHNNGTNRQDEQKRDDERDDKNGTIFSSDLSSFKEFLDSVKVFFSQLVILSKKVFDTLSKFFLEIEV